MNIHQYLFRSGGATAAAAIGAAALALGVSLAWPLQASASEADSPSSIVIGTSGAKSLQLGVGRSMIVDLPEDAAEIFVGEPKVANAIVRSPRRLYISTLSAGQTSIFALSSTGRKIAVLEITVGRDVGELAKLFEVAIPGNDIHIKTVGGSIILTGEVASAGEAQKALDISQGFLSNNQGALAGVAAGAAGAAAGGSSSQSGGVVNSLTIRGLDQVSLRVTISEIRRDIIKQLGINLSSTGGTNGLTNLAWTNPFSVNGASATESAALGWSVGSATLTATLQAYEQQGVAKTLAEPTVTAISGESAKFLAGGTIPIPGGESCSNGICQLAIIQQPYGVSLAFTPVVLSQSRIQLRIATEVIGDRQHIDPGLPHTQERNDRRTALGRFDRLCRFDLHSDPVRNQRSAWFDESPGAGRAVPLSRLSPSRDRTRDRGDALYRSRHRSADGPTSRRRHGGRDRSSSLVARQDQSHLLHILQRQPRARLLRQSRFHHGLTLRPGT